MDEFYSIRYQRGSKKMRKKFNIRTPVLLQSYFEVISIIIFKSVPRKIVFFGTSIRV